MADRRIPLHVFHFDCFWMKEFNWCDFEWDKRIFPDPPAMLKRLKERGLHICVWINPYIAQRSACSTKGMQNGYLLKKPNGDVWQWDRWQPGMGMVDFTNPAACHWFGDKLRALLDMGVDCFKTDFGERIPTDVVYSDGSDPEKMHNYYTYLYNQTVFEVLRKQARQRRGAGLCPLGHRRRPAVPRALGRRLHSDLRVDGRKPARRPVAGLVRLRLLEPRHRRLSGTPAGGCVQTLVRLRPAVFAQPPARQQFLPRAVALRRRSRGRAARTSPTSSAA